MWKDISAEPLPDDVVVRLRSDPTAALAAVLVVVTSFPNIVSWAARAFGGPSHPKRRVEGGDEANGGDGRDGKDGKDGDDWPSSRRGPASDRADQQLLALMRANPGATIARLTKLSGRSRSSIVLSLSRLKAAGLVDHRGRGSWTAVDADLVDAAPPSATGGWVAPLSGKQIARFAADGRVREEMSTVGS